MNWFLHDAVASPWRFATTNPGSEVLGRPVPITSTPPFRIIFTLIVIISVVIAAIQFVWDRFDFRFMSDTLQILTWLQDVADKNTIWHFCLMPSYAEIWQEARIADLLLFAAFVGGIILVFASRFFKYDPSGKFAFFRRHSITLIILIAIYFSPVIFGLLFLGLVRSM